MQTEKEKMISGLLYDASAPELVSERTKTRALLRKFNESPADDASARREILKQLIPAQGNGLWIEPPFFCDYGYNLTIGDHVYFNFNCIVLDVTRVQIGNNVFIGPSVQIYTAMHPMNYMERSAGLEFGKPVTIGSDVWIGGGAIICPGVHIGSRTIIGAGSVVTRDIAENVFAAGNPCREIKDLG